MASPNTAVTQNAVAVGLEDLRNSEWHIDTQKGTGLTDQRTMYNSLSWKKPLAQQVWVSLW